MAIRPSFLPLDAFEKAKSAIFDGQLQQGLAAVNFPSMLDDGISAVRTAAFGDPTATAWKPVEMPQADPLPMVTTERPEMLTVPPPPSGTPAGMPSAPRTVDATITAGPRPDQQLRPGETVGSVTLAGGSFTPEEAAAIQQAAQEEGVPVDMIAAIWDTEQSGATSVSSAGARGRGQVVPGQGYDLPGEDPSKPLDGARQTARALKDKYRIHGSWDEAGAAYFGYGVDSGGMDTNTYRERVRQNRTKYQQSAAIPGPDQSPNGTPITAPQSAQGTARPGLTGITPPQFGLGDADADAICGPVLAMAFARSNGRNPTIAEAKELATRYGGWTSAQGMGGPEAMAQTLRQMGVPATYREGPLDIELIRRETANGNPVGINTRGHYYVVEGVDADGRLDLGNSAKALRASGGRQWFKPEEIADLGMGAPTGVLLKDAPSSPTPSVAATDGRQSLNAGAGSAPAAPAPSPTDGAGSPTSAVPGLWSPDGPPYAPAEYASFQAAAGRAGGGGVMFRAPTANAPQEVGNDEYIDPDSGPREAIPGSVGASPVQPYGPPLSEAGPEEEAPSYTLADGRTEPPTPTGQWGPAQTVPNPQRPPATDPGQWLAEDSQSTPPEPFSPYGAPRSAVAGLNPGAAPVPPSPRGDPMPAGQVAAFSGEPDYAPQSAPTPYSRATTDAERRTTAAAGYASPDELRIERQRQNQQQDQRFATKDAPTEARRQINDQHRAQVDELLSGAQASIQNAPDEATVRQIRDGFVAALRSLEQQQAADLAQVSQSEMTRQNEMAESATRRGQSYSAADRAWDSGAVTAIRQGFDTLNSWYEDRVRNTVARPITDAIGVGQLGAESKDDYALIGAAFREYGQNASAWPEDVRQAVDAAERRINALQEQGGRYASERAPETATARGIVDVGLGLASIPLMPGYGQAARAIRGGTAVERAVTAGRVAAGTAIDPGGAVLQGGIEGVPAAVRGARSAAGRALNAGADARLPSSLGSGFRTIDGTDPLFNMRGRVVPPDVADTLDFPIRVPEDPSVVRAIEAAGGRVDPERGVDLYVTRAQGPDAAGGVATRGGVFYEAVPQGGRSSFATGIDDPNRVGGSQVIPTTPTRFRSPLVVDDAPGSQRGFDQAMEQMGSAPNKQEVAAAYERASADNEEAYANFLDVQRRHSAAVKRITALEKQTPGLAFPDTIDGPIPAGASPEWVDAWRAMQQVDQEYRAASAANDAAAEALQRANQQLNGGSIYRNLDNDIQAARREARQAARANGTDGTAERSAALKELVRKYGGDPDLIDDLLGVRGAEAQESDWAIRENILAAHARRNGYDGVVTVQPERVPFEQIQAHPAVKAAQDAETAAWKALEAAQGEFQAWQTRSRGIRGPLDPPPSAEEEFRVMNRASAARRAVDDAQEAVRQAEIKAQEELARGKITELVDVREARNPTPGGIDQARVDEARRQAGDAFQRLNQAESRFYERYYDDATPEDEKAVLRAEKEAALEALRAADVEVGKAMHAPPKPQGYTLRDDIPRRASTAGGSGFVPRLSDAQNAAQGALMSEGYASINDEDLTPQERLARAAGMGLIGVAAGRRMRPGTAGARVGSGVVPNAAPNGPRRQLRSQAIRATDAAEVSRIRLDKFPEEVRDLIEAGAKEQDWARTQRRGVISDDAVQQMAADDAVSVDSLIKKGKAGKAYNAEETVALRNAVASQASTVRQLSDEIADARANGMTPDLLIARRAAEATRLNGLIQVAEGARAEAGRTLRQYRQQARLIELNPQEAIQQIYKRLGGKETAEAAVDEYTKLVQDGANPIQLAKFWAKIENGKVTKSELFALYRRFNMLSGPRTVEVNALSGAVNVSYEVLGRALGQVARGRVHEAAAEVAAPFKAMSRAGKNFAETLWHGVSTEQASRTDIPSTLSMRTDNKAAKAALTVLETPDRINAAVDQFFRTMTEDWAATMLAHKQAREGGLVPRSKEWAETVAKNIEAIRDDPSKFPEVKAMADHVTFSDEPGTLGKSLENLKRNHPNTVGFILPFIRTPYNIASKAIDMSPLGVVRTGVEAATGIGRGRKNMSRRLRDNVVGMTAAYLAYEQAQQGNVTGKGPDDPEKAAMLRATGWQPYSIKIGDKYWSYANFAPFSLTLAAGAAAHESKKYAKPGETDTASLLWDTGKRTGSVVTDMTVLAGLGAVIKAQQDPERYGTQWLSQALTQLMPAGSLVNTVGQATDDQLRRSERTDPATQISQNLQARIPGLRETVPAALDPLGRPIPNDQSGWGAVNPFRPTTQRPNRTIQTFLDAGVDIGAPPKTIQGKDAMGKSAALTLSPVQQRRYQMMMGQELQQRMGTMADQLSMLPRDERQKRLQTILRESREAASDLVMAGRR